MTLVELVRSLLGKVRDSAEVSVWCQAQYKTGVSLYLGYDMKSPPGPGAVPFVLVSDATWVDGVTTKKEATVTLAWGVSCSDVTTRDGIVEVDGSLLSEEFGRLIFDAVNGIEAEYTITQVDLSPGMATEWSPLFPGTMTITAEVR